MEVHGRWRIGIVGNNLLLVQAFDSWNEQAVEAYMAEFLAYVEKITSDRWAYIADAREWQLTIPDANEPANELYKHLVGLVCDVNIIKRSIQRFAIDEVLDSLEEDCVSHYTVNSVSDALSLMVKHEIETDEAKVISWFEQGQKMKSQHDSQLFNEGPEE